jgi:hypothetical protein
VTPEDFPEFSSKKQKICVDLETQDLGFFFVELTFSDMSLNSMAATTDIPTNELKDESFVVGIENKAGKFY